MTRVAKARIAYIALLLAIGAPVLSLVSWFDDGRVAAAAVVVLLVPGRIQGALLRNLFRGRRELEAGRPDASIRATTRFLDELQRRPALRHAIWLAWWSYTPHVEAMALNNLGAAHLELGRLDQAERAFADALARDPLYPVPWTNRAVVARARGDVEQATRSLEQARALGYSGGSLDWISRRAAELLTRLEGR
jgi:tetratricopeptide (TPR) repeat protein